MSDRFLGPGPEAPGTAETGIQAVDSKKENVPVLLDRSGEAAEAKLTPEEQKKHGRVRQHLQIRRERKATVETLMDVAKSHCIPLVGVNLRDVGAVTRGPLQIGRLFRSSELLSKEEMRTHGIKTILDLRRMDRPCKKDPNASKAAESTKTIVKYLLMGPTMLVPEKRLLYVHRAQPHFCSLCEKRAGIRFEMVMHVIHADLIPSTVGLRIFQSMPKKVQAKAILMACIGKGAASVMAPAVANPLLLGYKVLYRTLLEDSKRGMALALRPFVEESNYPILVHCIHGKDRTGLIIMLLLLLCDVDAETIVDDYVLSETVLKESRMHEQLNLDVYLTSDDVIAATRDTMEETICYVQEKYDSAAGYMHEIGLEDWEIAKIRSNLMKAEEANLQPLPTIKPKFSFHSFLPFARRASSSSTPASSQRRLSRTSSPLPGKIHGTAEDRSPSIPELQEVEQDGNPILRRASLANSGPEEIRCLFKNLRAQHPELGAITEGAPIDFLRNSPTQRVPVGSPLSEPQLHFLGENGCGSMKSRSKSAAASIEGLEEETSPGGEQAARPGPGGAEAEMLFKQRTAKALPSPFADS